MPKTRKQFTARKKCTGAVVHNGLLTAPLKHFDKSKGTQKPTKKKKKLFRQ